jgi:amino acid permease
MDCDSADFDAKPLIDDGDTDDNDDGKTVYAATLNLFSTFVGGGIMGLPYAFQKISIIPSASIAAMCALFTALSLYFLAVVAEHLPAKTFTESARVFGPRSVFAMDMFTTIVLCGVIISLQILIKDNCKKMVEGFGSHGGDHALTNGVVLLACVCSCVMLPLALLRRVEFLRYSSFGAIFSILYVVVLVIAKGGTISGVGDPHQTNYVNWNELSSSNLVSFAPVIVFAFGCQVQVTPIYWSLPSRERSVSRFVPLFSAAVFSAFAVFVAMGTFGVLAFPSRKFDSGDVLLNFDPKSTTAIVGRLALTVSLSLMSPLLVFPARDSIKAASFSCLGNQSGGSSGGGGRGKATDGDGHDGEQYTHFAELMHVVITCAIIGCTFAIAASVEKVSTSWFAYLIDLCRPYWDGETQVYFRVYCIHALYNLVSFLLTPSFLPLSLQVGVVYDLLGSFGGSFLFYIFPAICYLKLCADRRTTSSGGCSSKGSRRRSSGAARNSNTPMPPELQEWWGFHVLAWTMVIWGVLIAILGISSVLCG